MDIKPTISHKCLHTGRPEFHYYMYGTVFPKTDTNADLPGAAAKNTAIKNSFGAFFVEHGAGRTIAANIIYEKILTETVSLFDYVEFTAGSNLQIYADAGLVLNKTVKTPNPQTGVPTNVNWMTLNGGRFKLEYESDQYAHSFQGRTRIKGGTDADWKVEEVSQNHTMYFENYSHGVEYEVQVRAVGTAGASDWSVSVFVLVQ